MARSITTEIELALDRALEGLAVVEDVERREGSAEAEVRVRGGTREYRLRALWAGAGWPADVDRAIGRLGEIGDLSDERRARLVVVARQLSPGSRKRLDSKGVSWVDGSGDAHIVGGDLLVVREARRQRDVKRRALSWSPSAVSVAEALLSRNSPSGVQTGQLARETGFSTPQVSQVLGAFDAEGWTTKWGPQRGRGARREISDARRMLDAWAEEVSAAKQKRRFAERIFSDPMQFLVEELGGALGRHGISWAATGWAAAEQLAPLATILPTLQIYVEERAFQGPLTLAMQDAGVHEVASGGRIEFRSADPELLRLAVRSDGISLASAPRVFADLQALGGRGEEAAMHLRDEAILPRLRPKRRQATSGEMNDWDERCRERLKKRVARELDGAPTVYESGTWSVSYRLPEATLPLAELLDALVAVEGHETGWPVWWVGTQEGIEPEISDGAIECWFREQATHDYGHADFWRVEPELKLFLLRSYEEDGLTGPGMALDPALHVRRIAESLLHAARLARNVNANDIELFARWERLQGRELRALTSEEWDVREEHVGDAKSVTTFIRTSGSEIDRDLPSVVRTLVSPLFENFGSFEPQGSLYATELETMLKTARAETSGWRG